MEKLENVIKALQLCRYDPDEEQPSKQEVSCDICHYYEGDYSACNYVDMLNDAIRLLKSLVPHIITADDFKDNPNVCDAGYLPVWVEHRRDDEVYAEIFSGELDGWVSIKETWLDSFRSIRVWSARPSKEQMEHTPWK